MHYFGELSALLTAFLCSGTSIVFSSTAEKTGMPTRYTQGASSEVKLI